MRREIADRTHRVHERWCQRALEPCPRSSQRGPWPRASRRGLGGRLLALAAAAALAGGCASTASTEVSRHIERTPDPAAARAARPLAEAVSEEASRRKDAGFYRPGTGVFTAPDKRPEVRSDPAGNINLDFTNTALAEVVKFILGEVLQTPFVVDPKVKGVVTLQTSRPVSRDSLLPMLEMILRMNGAALVHEDGVYRVIPREDAFGDMVAPQLGDSQAPLPQGFSVRIVPLRYIAASEMEKILKPFVHPGNLVRVDRNRNLVILAGTRQELKRLLETVRVFDVDWLKGMSVALFTPDFVDAKTLVTELQQVFGDAADGPLAGLVRLVTIDRLNAVLAVTARAEYLKKVKEWVERLDKDTRGAGRRLFVYHVQNGRAADLAQVLSNVLSEEQAAAQSASQPPSGLPPPPDVTATPPEAAPQPSPREQAAPGETPSAATPPASTPPASTPERRSATASEGIAVSEESPVRIIADEVNNALLIMATPHQYAQVHAALRKLDIMPLQVLIEATIAEITLTKELRFGLEWFVNHNLNSSDEGTVQLDLNPPGGIAAQVPGFSYFITDSVGTVKFVLNTLAADSRLNVLSSPSLMVLNNQTAEIQVGDEVPVTTQQQQATVAASTVVNTIEYRNTGVLLTVTPRVNAGGLVTMDISQQVSDVAPGSGGSLTPTIQQRLINSTVAVQSGETVVLGGLIRENDSVTKSGIPLLHRLPVIGPLFGQTTNDHRRTELVVLITPRAVRDAAEARGITEEFRSKMQSLRPLTDSLKPAHTADPADAPAKDREDPPADRSMPPRPAGMPSRAGAPDVSPSYSQRFQTPGR